MADNKFKKYLWLINTIKSFGPISYDGINRLWLKSSLNEWGDDLPKKTFRNHLNAIAEIFDIEILCERKGGYLYYIGENLSSDRWTRNYLDSLLFQFSLLDDDKLKNTVYDIDNDNDIDDRIYFIMGCIKNHFVISFTYFQSYAILRETEPKQYVPDYERKHANFAPLGLVHADRKWFVIGKALDTDMTVPIMVFRMQNLAVTEGVTYNPTEQFAVRDYINSFTFECTADYVHIHANDDSFDFTDAIKNSSNIIRF